MPQSDPSPKRREHHSLEAAEHAMAQDASVAHSAIDAAVADADAGRDGLGRALGPVNLVAIGVAAVVGAGIFVVTGEAAATRAGPAVPISFLIAGCVAALSALCYAELASMIPLAGSTYSYAYASMGTFVAWVIGWDLLTEYLFGAANVANGWSGYFVNVLHEVGIDLPTAFTAAPIAGTNNETGILNIPAMVLVAVLSAVLIYGVKQSAQATTVLVGVKLLTLALFVGFGFFAIKGTNYVPFVPSNTGGFQDFGWTGVIAAAGVVFYSFISFDAVCTAAQEARNPRRTVPIGVLGSLGIATVLYILVGIVLVGMVSYTTLMTSNPLTTALEEAGLGWLGAVVDVGATIGLGASVLALLYSQTRILMRMSEDGMLPKAIGAVHHRTKTPITATVICACAAIVMAGILPLTILTELVSIGTLFAFIIVSAAVMILRRTRPDLERPFRVPGGPIIPILAIITSFGIILTLPVVTWLRLIVWLVIGLIIYFSYSRKRAHAIIEDRAARARTPHSNPHQE